MYQCPHAFPVVYVLDAGDEFDAPREVVWEFVGSPPHHSGAHQHRATDRRRISERVGEYSWEQDFDGAPARFTMRWTVFPPVGIAYEVLEGPFTGSVFFLYYEPRGDRTAVTVAGEFVSPTLPAAEIAAAVDRFFSIEFRQDHEGIRRFRQEKAGGR